jgi:hypothetical protein
VRRVDAQRGVPRHTDRLVFVYTLCHGDTVAPSNRGNRRRVKAPLSPVPCYSRSKHVPLTSVDYVLIQPFGVPGMVPVSERSRSPS